MTNQEFSLILIGIGALLTAAFLTPSLSRRFGLPSLLLYLGLGLLFGNGGEGDFLFDAPQLVERCSELALGFILFKGGYEFRHSLWKKPKVLGEGLCLALVGSLLTALLTATAARLFLSWSWLEAFLLGAVLCSTDAAAVFSVFQTSGLKTKSHTTEVLEVESSTNDPLAYALVIGLVEALQGADLTLANLILSVATGLLIGFLVGLVVGGVLLSLTRLAGTDHHRVELLWLAVLTSALGLAGIFGGNPLITAYVAGVVLSARRKQGVVFWGPLVSLSEVVLFLLLGLQVFPQNLMSFLGPALLVTFVLVFVSRPVAVLITSSFFERDFKRSMFMAWAGLRGASPIVFGLFPLIAGVGRANEIFSIVFTVVVVSVLLQGTTLTMAAQKLGLAE